MVMDTKYVSLLWCITYINEGIACPKYINFLHDEKLLLSLGADDLTGSAEYSYQGVYVIWNGLGKN